MDSTLYLGCDNARAANIPKQFVALDLDPSDRALEYEDRIYDEYRTEIGNVFAVLAQDPQIQFDLYHFLKDSKAFINGGTKKQSLAKKSQSEFIDVLNCIHVKTTDSATRVFLNSVAQAVNGSNADATYEQLVEKVFNHLSNSAQESLAESDGTLLQIFHLKQNYPNPFNPATTISFWLREKSFVSLAVYNTVGQKVATLVDKELPAGEASVTWDASGFSSGIYFMKMQAGNSVEVRKMILTR